MDADLARAANRLVCDQMAVRPGESVLVTTDDAADLAAAEAVFVAAAGAGAKPNLMLLPQLPFQGMLADPYVPPALRAAALASDVWIDLTLPYFAGSHLHDEAMKVADKIANLSQHAVMMIKEAINRGFATSLAEGMRFERGQFYSLFATEDQKEGMAAFIEKRKPEFRNK